MTFFATCREFNELKIIPASFRTKSQEFAHLEELYEERIRSLGLTKALHTAAEAVENVSSSLKSYCRSSDMRTESCVPVMFLFCNGVV